MNFHSGWKSGLAFLLMVGLVLGLAAPGRA